MNRFIVVMALQSIKEPEGWCISHETHHPL
jgi:hypothetical protein